MKLLTPLIAAGLALAAFAPPVAARSSSTHHHGQSARYTRYHSPKHHTPPGWHKGKKTGWNGHKTPPGQWKKYHNDRNDRYDRNDRDDRYDRNDRSDRNQGTWDQYRHSGDTGSRDHSRYTKRR